MRRLQRVAAGAKLTERCLNIAPEARIRTTLALLAQDQPRFGNANDYELPIACTKALINRALSILSWKLSPGKVSRYRTITILPQ